MTENDNVPAFIERLKTDATSLRNVGDWLVENGLAHASKAFPTLADDLDEAAGIIEELMAQRKELWRRLKGDR